MKSNREGETNLTESIRTAFAEVGATLPRVLLPSPGVDLRRFAVIACDQFTASRPYWDEVEHLVGDAPSALRLMLPEIDLKKDNSQRVSAINRAMQQYLDDRTLTDVGETLVYLRRRTTTGIRRGLLIALDLDEYDFHAGATTMIRATEGTIIDRLPPRVAIRKNAPLEMPHVMVLIDDRENKLMNTIEERLDSLECLYDVSLMSRGGQLTGYRVDEPSLLALIARQLAALREQGEGFLYAMGDGNHSFASAKVCWEEIKPNLTEEQRKTHPARYALCELVSLHDPALSVEPIHRVVYGVDPEAFCRELSINPACPPDAQVLQPLLDEWLSHHPEAELEYIHGEADCRAVATEASDRVAIVFPPFDRDSLFTVVQQNGAFVRKSFSLGEGRDKRYYLECRRIRRTHGEN